MILSVTSRDIYEKIRAVLNKINKIKAYFGGWREVENKVLADLLYRKDVKADLYIKGFSYMLISGKHKTTFPIGPSNQWGELDVWTNAEYFDYLSKQVDRLKKTIQEDSITRREIRRGNKRIKKILKEKYGINQ